MADTYNLAQLAEDSLARLGDHEALVFEGQTFRWAALHERAGRVAGGLADLGVAPGERVVVLMANCPEVLIAYHAIWRAGAVVTPVVFLVTAAELAHILLDSGAVALVTTTELLRTALDAASTAPAVRQVILAGSHDPSPGPDARARLIDFADLERAERRARVDRADTDLAVLMYTGGTTGRAKASRSATAISGARAGAPGRRRTCPGPPARSPHCHSRTPTG